MPKGVYKRKEAILKRIVIPKTYSRFVEAVIVKNILK
jgi:hypothetical protein